MALQYPMYNAYSNQYGLTQPVINPMVNQGQFQIQNGGFIAVPSEEDARKYPVAPGNSVTFKNENAPYVYTKTMGFSQLDRPLFEKFRLVKEEDTEVQKEERNESEASETEPIKYLMQEDLSPLVKDIKNIQTKIKEIDSVLEGLKSSCDSSVKQITTSAKSSSKTASEKGGK